ncbi:MAG: radical SAM protein [Gemmatimonadota bacterium]|nr:MAG: radical SAM protein [Gemmatimonadota bacterium]
MVYSLQTSCVYGPVNSRRLGSSLGINLLPSDVKLCSFDCVYCHYGVTEVKTVDQADSVVHFPSLTDVTDELRQALKSFSDRHERPEYITFSGNGEPTLHPQFSGIVDEVKALRDQYVPDVPVAVLSNSTTVHLPSVREALMKLDRRIMKLDAGDAETFQAVNRPAPSLDLEEIIEGLCHLKDLSIQSAFMRGGVENIGRRERESWIQALERIKPNDVQMYTIDRPSADGRIERVERSILEEIAQEVADRTGVKVRVY